MSNEFPAVSVTHAGSTMPSRKELFRVAIPEVDKIVSAASIEYGERSLQVSPDIVLNEFDVAIGPAVQLLATAAAFCKSCPVRKSEVCTGIKKIDLSRDNNYEARLIVAGVGDHSSNNATTQLAGARCGINAEQLNKISPVKLR